MNEFLRKIRKSNHFKCSTEKKKIQKNTEEEKIWPSQILSIKNSTLRELKMNSKIGLSTKFWSSILLKYLVSTFSRKNISIHSDRESLNFFSKSLILQHREKFNYFHVDFVLVDVKPLLKLGLNIPVLNSLPEKRHEKLLKFFTGNGSIKFREWNRLFELLSKLYFVTQRPTHIISPYARLTVKKLEHQGWNSLFSCHI